MIEERLIQKNVFFIYIGKWFMYLFNRHMKHFELFCLGTDLTNDFLN